ncbi:ABC transporter ATP-binding protein [Granulicoccus sp. GXG6511]|uniref:ABC transporter ATP-binding protein n=1 Tax=Granulicoccus sp. GXG6511 TaxID=3381351 RepID=UPI003D7E51D0
MRAVRGADLLITPGETVALLGPNGAGKTTLLDMICGLTRPTAGTVRVLGRSPRRAVAAGRVSAVLQSGGLLPDLTVGETVDLFARLHRARDRADAVLQEVALSALKRRRVGACSGGEQQRLRIALSLIPDPEFLILDEPTTGMDLGARQSFWRGMRQRMASGSTLLYATHYLDEVDGVADRVLLMAAGRIVVDGSVAEVRRAVGVRILRGRLRSGPDERSLTALADLQGVTRVSPGPAGTIDVVATPETMDEVARVALVRQLLTDITIEDASLEAGLAHLLGDEARVTVPDE